MRRTARALVSVLALAALGGCGTERGSSPQAAATPVVDAGQSPIPTRPQPVPTVTASNLPSTSGAEPTVQTPTATASVEPEYRWYGDGDESVTPEGGLWVAAWFSPDQLALPNQMVRYWQQLPLPPGLTAAEQLVHSVELLATTPPLGTQSAFGKGLEVLGVTLVDGQVVLDLAAHSPGLHGHSTHGLILGEAQLLAAVAHYFPDATALCVTYDGRPTDSTPGAPSFLHDADGCPLPLPSA